MLTIWDYIVIAFYLIFMLAIGGICKHLSKDSSDFFRSGGKMVWWITGMSGLAAALSAYSFTVGAAMAYKTGFFIILIYFLGSINRIIDFYIAPKFRQMRVVTAADAIRRRYGKISEQFWVWVSLPFGLIMGGCAMYMVSNFMSAALGINIYIACTVMTTVVTIMAMSGGSWAVAISDFIQMMIIIFISVTIAIRVFFDSSVVGGISGYFSQMPEGYCNFDEFSRTSIWVPFMLLTVFSNVIRSFDVTGEGARYLYVKSSKQARKAVTIVVIGSFLAPVICLMPVFAVKMMDINLAAMFPNMTDPSEGAYLALAHHLLPTGMMGLMLCAIFAATMSSMDTALNRAAGFIVKNFYSEFIRPDASPAHNLKAGRVFTGIFGCILLGVSLIVAKHRSQDMFSMMMKLSVLLAFPMVIPMTLGILYKRTPRWAAWSTALVGFATAAITQNLVDIIRIAEWFGLASPFTGRESADLGFTIACAATTVVTVAWFFGTSFFYKYSCPEHKESVKSFFKDLQTPIVEDDSEESAASDREQFGIVAWLLLVFGAFILLGVLIPNPLSGRMLFLIAAIFFGGTGLWLRHFSRKTKQKDI